MVRWVPHLKLATFVASVGAAAACALLAATTRFAVEDDAKEADLRGYVQLIEALAHRKRVAVLFPNPQSIFDGYHIGFVNVGAGNLTFRRRDLVTRTPAMIVEFARVYDSRIEHNDDFGAGWRLSLAEELWLDDGALIYVDRAGARHRFASDDGVEYRASPMTPRHSQTRITVGEKETVVRSRDGTTRTFERQRGAPGKYVVSTFKTANGGETSFSYQDGLLASVHAEGRRIFVLARDEAGKVASVRDLPGRVVGYSYTASGQLKDVFDVAGNPWRHEYGEFGLTRAVGPNGQPLLAVRYLDGKVAESRAARSYSFAYGENRTDVADGFGVQRTFANLESGITHRLASSDGTDWQLALGTGNEITELRTAKESHAFWYDDSGRLAQMRRSSSDGSQDWTLTYEGERLVRILSDDGATTIDYQGGTTRLSMPSSYKVEFTVADGRLQRVESRDEGAELPRYGRTVEIAYSASGDVSAIESRTLGRPDAQGAHFTRNALGQITSTRYASGFEGTYEYDALGNRVSVRYTGGTSRHYAYDPSGNMVGVSSSAPDGLSGTQSYSIGEMNRVATVRNGDGKSMDIGYDSNGNAVEFKTDDDTVHAKYQSEGRLARIWSSRTGAALAVDDDMQYDLEVDRVHERTPAKRAVLTRSAFEALQPHYGTVTFGETSHAAFPVDPFDLLDAHVPHYFNVSAILDLAGLFAYSPVADFEKPSNPAFHPPEYRARNGCIPCLATGCSCATKWDSR